MKKLILLLTLPTFLFAQADKASWMLQKDNVSGNARVTTRTAYVGTTEISFELTFFPELTGKKILSITESRSASSTDLSRVAVLRVPRQGEAATAHLVSAPDTSEGAQNIVHVVPIAALYPGDKIVLPAEAGGISRSVTIEFQP